MKKPTILFLAHTEVIHTRKWVEYFVHRGWQVYIISFQMGQIPGTRHIFLNSGKINPRGGNYKYLLKVFHIIYYVWKIKPDILNCHFLTSYGILGYLTFYQRLTLSLYGTDVFISSNKNYLYSFIIGKILRKSELIFSVSNEMTKFLLQNFHVDDSNIITKQYGIDLNTFSCNNLSGEREFTFITNRTFIENSNYFLLLEIMAKIRSVLDFKLLVVGSGPLKSQIEEKVIDLKLEKNVIIKNSVSHTQLAKYLNDSLIYISLTSSDGTPLSVFEAAACGAYPLLSDIQPNREWLDKGLTGLTVPLNNVDAIIKSIIGLFYNIDDINFRNKNVNFVNREMNYDKNMRFIESHFLKLFN